LRCCHKLLMKPVETELIWLSSVFMSLIYYKLNLRNGPPKCIY
jgi:hypothetical protein